MKDNLTELVFILDRSGSMGGLEADTVGGCNSFIEKQKGEDGEAYLTTVLFDDKYELLHDRADIQSVRPLTSKEYFVRGSTALLDAIGITVDAIGKKLSDTPEPERPERVLFVITTDGMENASREYSVERVRGMIEHQKEKYAWEFLFLGANIDAIGTARSIGISQDRAVRYCCDSAGVGLNYEVMSEAVSEYRAGKLMRFDWKAQIEDDYAKREGKKSPT